MYKYVHKDKYQMKCGGNAKHSEGRKIWEDNIYVEWSEAGNYFGEISILFRKIITNFTLRPPNVVVMGELLVPTQFFQVLYHFPRILIFF